MEQLVRAYLPRAAVDDLLVDADSLVHAQIMQWLGFVVGTVKPAMRSGDQGAQKAFAKVRVLCRVVVQLTYYEMLF